MKLKFGFLSIFVFFVSLSCSQNKTEKLYPPSTIPKQVLKEQGTVASTERPKADILFVVDSSGSMGPKQDNLAKNVELFAKTLTKSANIDYRIAILQSSTEEYTESDIMNPGHDRKYYPYKAVGDPVLITDPSGNHYDMVGDPKFITPETPDKESRLSQRLVVGTSGSGHEVFFDVVLQFLADDALTGDPFIRPKSQLAVIFVTDAAEQSSIVTTGLDFFTKLGEIKGDPRQVVGYGAIVPTNGASTCDRDDPNVTPVELEAFIDRSGGEYFDLCSPTFGASFANIAVKISRRAGARIFLKELPDPKTLKVYFQNDLVDPKFWSYDATNNSIVMGSDYEFPENNNGKYLDVVYTAAALDNKKIVTGK